ncbi:MAG: hypothetical protein OEU54_01775 [Gemmatimonadota bacterium]|nr:hypothetical protein [Gemmatimonadota bacterium]
MRTRNASGARTGADARSVLSAGALAAALWAGPAAAQECAIERGPDHGSWHERARSLIAFEEELAGVLREAGQAPLGSIAIRTGGDGPAGIERRMLTVPAEAEDAFSAVLARIIDAPTLASEETLWIDFGAPRPELWPDRTEICGPELDNVAEAGALLAQVMAGAIQREGKARPAGRVRLDFWVLVDWTGRVSEIEFREDQGTWSWLVPYLEAMAPALRYRPATLNGAPRTTWVPQQFELEF